MTSRLARLSQAKLTTRLADDRPSVSYIFAQNYSFDFR
jgi:hypothetical protein